MPHQLQLLLCDYENYRWALDSVLAFLDAQDGMRLVFAALESGDHGFLQLGEWLMDGDAPFPKLRDSKLLDESVKLECWHAAEILSQKLQRAAQYPINWHKQHAAIPHEQCAFHRVMVAAVLSRHTFQCQVTAAVAARGDVVAVRCLLAVANAFDSLTNSEIASKMAFQAAAEARQLDVCDWLARHSSVFDCIVPYDIDLKAMCCVQSIHGSFWRSRDIRYVCASAKYGFSEYHLDSGNRRGRLVIRFAQHGDVEMLETLRARGISTASILADSLERAVEGGHIAVLEWVYNKPHHVYGEQDTVWNGQPLHTHIETRRLFGKLARKAAYHGHLHILRWFQQHTSEAFWIEYANGMCTEAISTSQLEIVRFFHEACGVQRTTWGMSTFVESASVDFVHYVLDMFGPGGVNGRYLLEMAAAKANRDVVAYLVLDRGFWSPRAFGRAVYHTSTSTTRLTSVEICRFLYLHAQERARELGTLLETEVAFGNVKILRAARYGNYETARWLAEGVMQADTGETLAPFPTDEQSVFPRTPEARAVVLACLRNRREQCRGLAWLPQWAVDANCFEAFGILIDMDHPSIQEVLATITEKVRDSRFMIKVLTARDVRLLAPAFVDQIITWAARVGSLSVLSVLEKSLGVNMLARPDHWIRLSSVNAVRYGHVDVLQWLHGRGILSITEETLETVNALVRIAAQYNRVECLQWLVRTLDVPVGVISEVFVQAATQRDVRIVQWLLRHYALEDLQLSPTQSWFSDT